MRSGRKPQPTAIRLLRGNPSKEPINAHEPQHPPIEVEAADPPELRGNAAAIAEYRRLGPRLAATGHVTQADRSVFLAYCYAWGEWVEAVAASAGQPANVTSATGAIHVNRVHERSDLAFGRFLRAAAECGLTPSSRTRVVARAGAGAASKWAGALK
jgi:P27 family predicted phage terminase small subunit